MILLAIPALQLRLSRACEVLIPTQLSASYTLASNTPGVLWVQGTYTDPEGIDPPFDYDDSGFVIGIEKDSTGKVLKTYIAIPMHTSAYPGQNVYLAGSKNFNDQDGLVLTNLQLEYQSPFWDPDLPDGTPGDVAIYSSTTVVPDNWVHALAPTNSIPYPGSGNPITGIATSLGYGYPSTTNDFLSQTGDPMGFRGDLVTWVPDDVEADSNYLGISMSPVGEPFLNGAANPGDSGSMVLNTNNQIIGMTVSSTGGATDTDRETIFENFTSPGFYEQVSPYAGIIVVPPTPDFSMHGKNFILSWNGAFTLQSATNAIGVYSDIPSATSPYTNAMTAPRRFFRLRSD